MSVTAAVIVDSRNAYHQAGDVCGTKALPTVAGVVAAFARLDYDVRRVHVGLALARQRDMAALRQRHDDNDAYRRQILSDPRGDVLLGELHIKSARRIEEKIVDVACCVRITRYIDEICYRRSDVDSLIVISRDIDLTPTYDYARECGIALTVAAPDVVQHRPHPYLLLGAHAFAEITGGSLGSGGHERRELLARALHDGEALRWVVDRQQRTPLLHHRSGLTGIPHPSVRLPEAGASIDLHPVDVDWKPRLSGSFPLLVLADRPATTPTWTLGTVVKRRAPMTLELDLATGRKVQTYYPLGGLVRGETAVVHTTTGQVLGRLPSGESRRFDPDTPLAVTVVARPARGGILAVGPDGRTGLVTSNQRPASGARLPVVQIDDSSRGPVWGAIGTPLPKARNGEGDG